MVISKPATQNKLDTYNISAMVAIMNNKNHSLRIVFNKAFIKRFILFRFS